MFLPSILFASSVIFISKMLNITFDLGEMGEYLHFEKSLHSSEKLIVKNNF